MSVGGGEQLATGLTEAILGAVTDGITVQDAGGRLVYANDAAARLSGFATAAELLAAAPTEILARFELLDDQRRTVSPAELPGRLALAEGRERSLTVCWRIRSTGEERWSVVRALPLEAQGAQYAVNVFRDITEQKRADDQLQLMVDASELLVSSLDLELTLDAIGTMLVPSVADYCLIDLLEEDGALRQVVQRHADPDRERALRELRRLYPPDGNSAHPVNTALASGEPVLIELATDEELRAAAVNDEHLELYQALDPSSYLVVPLTARGRAIGAMSLGMGESGRRYGAADIVFAQELAGRIALAADNARLFANARASYALLDTLLVSAPVGIGFWDRDLRFVRVNDALAEINDLPADEHTGKTLGDVKPELAATLEPLYRQVIETGEPVAHSESTDELGLRAGDRRHWLSSYYPVRTSDGEVTGVGAVIMDVTAERWADERLRLLAHAGELFASSLDADDVFSRIAGVIVPNLADSLHIFVAEGDHLQRVACAHSEPELVPVLESLPSSYPLGPGSPAFMATVFDRAEPVLFTDVSSDFYEHLEELGAERIALERIDSRSMMLVPLIARGTALGVLAVGSREAGRYSDDDLALTLELAGRAAIAIDNARLFREVSFRTTLLEAQQEASIDGLLVVSANGEITSYNRRFAELWDFPQELVAAGSDERALEVAMEKVADPEAFIARVHYLYAHPDETSREEVELKDGRVLDRYGAAVRSPSGEYYGWLWSFRDITEQKRAEAALVESDRRRQRVVDVTGLGEWELDLVEGRAWRSPRHDRIFGYETLLPEWTYEIFLEHVHPDDRAAVDAAFQAAVARSGEWDFECRIVRGDGAPAWIAVRGRVQASAEGVPLRMVGSVTDVTDRKSADVALRNAQATLEAAALAARVGTWVWDSELGRIVGDEFISFAFGFDSTFGVEGVPPETWIAAIDHEDQPRVAAAFELTLSTGAPYEIEFRVTGIDGVERWLLSRGVVETNAGGAVARVVGAVADLTERKRAEAEREIAEERIRFLAQASQALAVSFDYDETLNAVARLAVPVLAGLCFIDLVGADGELARLAAARDGDESFAARAQSFAPRVEQTEHPIVRTLSSGEPLVESPIDETWIERAATSPEHAAFMRSLEMSSLMFVPISAGQRRLGVLTLGATGGRRHGGADLEVAQELAHRAAVAIENARLYEQTESRAQAATALEFVGDGVFLVDGSDTIRLWNPSAAAITGLDADEMVDRPVGVVLPGWPLEQLGRRPETYPVDIGGRELWLSLTGVPFEGGTVYAFRDLTEERDVDRLKSDFVSTVSHELRTPLAAIYGAAMTLRRDDVPLSPAQRDGMLDVVSGEAERLARIVNDILLASRLDSDVVDVAIGRADAAELTRTVIAAAAAHLPPGIELTLSAPDDLPPIAADPDKLRQVLVNLVENAVKYSPDGGPVEVALAVRSSQMRFSVTDAGLGIPANEHARIFEKFYRLDPNLTRGVGGTGLGLYICREIVRRMNGRIWLESLPGRGSTFFVEVPLA